MKRALILLTLTVLACERSEESKQASGIPPYSPPDTTATVAQTAPPTDTAAATTSPIQVATPGAPTTPPANPFPSPDSARRIELAQLQAGIANNDVVVVDVRSPDTYAKSHIKGAINIPEGEIALRAGSLPRDKTIVTYCT